MRKRLAMIGVGAALALTPLSLAATPASASVCDDGWRLVIYYVSVDDQATAVALFDNLWSMGCR